MGFLPPLRKLQYVIAVARDLHFRKAAERLHVSQPAISRQVQEYEEEVGFKILQRDHHFVSLTKAGKAFVTDVEAILMRMESDFGSAVRRARAISRETPNEFIVAHSPFASMQIRRIAMELQQQKYCNLALRFRILPTIELLNAIDSGLVQAGITFAPVNYAGINAIPIGKDYWVAVVPANRKYSGLSVACIQEFKGERVISNGADRTHPELFRQLATECATKGFPLRPIAEVTSPHEAFDLVAGNTGIILLPAGACEHLPPVVCAIQISDISPLETVLIHRSDSAEFSQELADRMRTEIDLRTRSNNAHIAKVPKDAVKRKAPVSVGKVKSDQLPKRAAG